MDIGDDMKKPPFIKLYVKDFAFDTQELSNEELGAYMRSFLKAYKFAKIPNKNIDESLFIELENSLSKYSSVCERNKNNRLNSMPSNNESSTSGKRAVDAPVNQEPVTKNQEPITNKEYIYTQEFSDIWDVWPRKRRGNKDKAFAAYKSALKRDTIQNIQNGIQSYIDSNEAKGEYAKGCSAWFNDDRWTNDYTESKNQLTTNQPQSKGNANEELRRFLEQN